jgi:nicotinate-nucleotide--dimethylbenzimidazole phosphoribosyltransferase
MSDNDIYREIQKRWDTVAKPLNSLGVFEDMICRIGAVQGSVIPDISKRAVIIMCADNGIVEEGVSQCGQDVTAEVAGWMGQRESTVCRMAEHAGADIIPIDIGINMEGSPEGVINRKIRRGTSDFLNEPAMSLYEVRQAVKTGIETVRECRDKGYGILATGEMGIGNTTTASALCAALTGISVPEVTGRGAGLSDEAYRRKIEVIERGIELHGLRHMTDPIMVSDIKYTSDMAGSKDNVPKSPDQAERALACVGGLDIAGLAGVFIGGARYNIPVIIDGFISAVAALCSERMEPGTKKAMLASHMGKEAGMACVIKELGLKPVINAGMALGEGTGAVMLFPLLDMAAEIYKNGFRFEETGVEQYVRF